MPLAPLAASGAIAGLSDLNDFAWPDSVQHHQGSGHQSLQIAQPIRSAAPGHAQKEFVSGIRVKGIRVKAALTRI